MPLQAERDGGGIALSYSQLLRWRGVGGQHRAPATLRPEKNRYPLYMQLVGPRSRYGRAEKISLPPGSDPWTVQAVAIRYTDQAIPAATVQGFVLIISSRA